jgi:hypothetical protein
MQKETMRQRQVEFLQVTANPIDMGIIGPKGRAAVLRNVSNTLGMPGDEIVPTDDEIQQQQAQAQQLAMMTGAAGHQQTPAPPTGTKGAAAGPPGAPSPSPAPGGPPGQQPGAGGARPGAPSQQPGPSGESQQAQAPRAALFKTRPGSRA